MSGKFIEGKYYWIKVNGKWYVEKYYGEFGFPDPTYPEEYTISESEIEDYRELEEPK